MRVGIPKEIKNNENRVSMTPACIHELVVQGATAVVETGAGDGSGFPDEDYQAAGAAIGGTAEAWACDLIVKVKEPQPSEYQYFRPDLILFTYLHLAANEPLVQQLRSSGVRALAYEMVQMADGSLPLLAPMSEIAGRLGAMMAEYYLLKTQGGRGLLAGGVPGVEKARFTIIGAGTAGRAALQAVVGMGADVTVLDNQINKLARLEEQYQSRIKTLFSNRQNLDSAVTSADAVISTVLVPGARAPHLVTDDMVRRMAPGSVIVDIAIDQGGSVETIPHSTTHDQPILTIHGVTHYAVANMPGAVPRTATTALSNATLPYVLLLARSGIESCKIKPELDRALFR
jgi:alanine dehydrogenase